MISDARIHVFHLSLSRARVLRDCARTLASLGSSKPSESRIRKTANGGKMVWKGIYFYTYSYTLCRVDVGKSQ